MSRKTMRIVLLHGGRRHLTGGISEYFALSIYLDSQLIIVALQTSQIFGTLPEKSDDESDS